MRALANGAAAAAVLSWGVGNVMVKVLEFGILSLGFHRLWISSVLLGAVVLAKGGHLRVGDLRVAVASGVAFALNIVFLFSALKLTTVANASVIVALQPIAVLVIAARRFGETIRVVEVLLASLAIGGVALVVFGSTGLPEWHIIGDLAAILSLGTWTWYFTSSKRARRRLGAVSHQFMVAAVGAVVLLPILLISNQAVVLRGMRPWVGVLLLVIVPGGGHFLMSWAHGHTSLSLTSLLTLGTPVVSIIGAALVLGETVTGLQVAGMVVVAMSLGLFLTRSPVLGLPPESTMPSGRVAVGLEEGVARG
jgi:drug/metabolite transporter (DMT)-like permease